MSGDDDDLDFWHQGPPRRRGHDWSNDPDRLLSITVRCRHCTAPIGVACRNLAGPLGTPLPFAEAPELAHLPAHPIRLTDARGEGPQ